MRQVMKSQPERGSGPGQPDSLGCWEAFTVVPSAYNACVALPWQQYCHNRCMDLSSISSSRHLLSSSAHLFSPLENLTVSIQYTLCCCLFLPGQCDASHGLITLPAPPWMRPALSPNIPKHQRTRWIGFTTQCRWRPHHTAVALSSSRRVRARDLSISQP